MREGCVVVVVVEALFAVVADVDDAVALVTTTLPVESVSMRIGAVEVVLFAARLPLAPVAFAVVAVVDVTVAALVDAAVVPVVAVPVEAVAAGTSVAAALVVVAVVEGLVDRVGMLPATPAGTTGAVALTVVFADCVREPETGAVALTRGIAPWLAGAIVVAAPDDTFPATPIVTGALTAPVVAAVPVETAGDVAAALTPPPTATLPPPPEPPTIAPTPGEMIELFTVATPGFSIGAGLIGSATVGAVFGGGVEERSAFPNTRPRYAWSAASTAIASTAAAARSDCVTGVTEALAMPPCVDVAPEDAPGVEEGTVAGSFAGWPLPGWLFVVQPMAASMSANEMLLTAFRIWPP